MKQNKSTKKSFSAPKGDPLFNKENYKFMLIGVAVMAIGFFLMPGGRSDNPDVFRTDVIYSFTHITLSPILIVGGLAIEVYAIMRKGKKETRA